MDVQYLKWITKDNYLTKALRNTNAIVSDSSTMINYIAAVLYGSHSADTEERILCIYLEVDETLASYWRLTALIFSLFIGLGSGLGSRNAQLGLDIGSCMLAALLVLQSALQVHAASHRVI